jgi:hypothetical protein
LKGLLLQFSIYARCRVTLDVINKNPIIWLYMLELVDDVAVPALNTLWGE